MSEHSDEPEVIPTHYETFLENDEIDSMDLVMAEKQLQALMSRVKLL